MPTGVYPRKPAPQRFEAKFERGGANACWPWLGAASGGYGSFHYDGQKRPAHRFAFAQYVRPLRKGEVVDHLCRNSIYVNPSHLEAVSMAENTKRGLGPAIVSMKGRSKTHCKRDHPLFGDNLIRDKRGYRCCKTCQKAKAKEWAQANRERVNELQRIRRAA